MDQYPVIKLVVRTLMGPHDLVALRNVVHIIPEFKRIPLAVSRNREDRR